MSNALIMVIAGAAIWALLIAAVPAMMGIDRLAEDEPPAKAVRRVRAGTAWGWRL